MPIPDEMENVQAQYCRERRFYKKFKTTDYGLMPLRVRPMMCITDLCHLLWLNGYTRRVLFKKTLNCLAHWRTWIIFEENSNES